MKYHICQWKEVHSYTIIKTSCCLICGVVHLFTSCFFFINLNSTYFFSSHFFVLLWQHFRFFCCFLFLSVILLNFMLKINHASSHWKPFIYNNSTKENNNNIKIMWNEATHTHTHGKHLLHEREKIKPKNYVLQQR